MQRERLELAMRILLPAALACVAACTRFAGDASEPAPPGASRGGAAADSVVTDDYHGVTVTDPYRWLEDWDDPAVQAWSEARNQEARNLLSALPGRPDIRAELEELLGAESVSYYQLAARAPGLFAMKQQPPRQQPFLVLLTDPQRLDSERVIVDPNSLDPTGGTTIDWYVPSPDGSLVAVSLSVGGSESGDLHVFDVATGARVGEIVPRVQGGTAGGDMAWLADGSGYFYTRYPRDGERAPEDTAFFQQVWFHRLGTAVSEDRYELGRDFPRIAEIRLQLDPSSGRLLATVQDGDSGRFALHLRAPGGAWTALTDFDDAHTLGQFGPGGDLFVLTREGAPRGRLVRLPPGASSMTDALPAVPEADGAIGTTSFYYFYTPEFLVTRDRVYVRYQVGGPQVLAAYDYDGRPLPAPPQPEIASVSGLTPIGGDAIIFATRTYTEPTTWYRYRPETGEADSLPLSSTIPVSFADVTVRREFAASKDGTKVPVNILVPAGAATDGSAPLLLTAYGGYGISLSPGLRLTWRVPLDRGVIVAQANIRGGGEYGDAWHRAGSLLDKQNGFDDFAAVIEHLVARGYTRPDRIAIMGGSNGGLLMGATMTQRPELVGAVVSFVGVYDMLRSELTPNGVFNIPEYGSVKDPAQFRALYAYSPYHNVRQGTAYPPTLFLTGANDPRVDPMHSRKMAARLEEATSSEAPILLRTSSDTGHGAGTPLDAQIEEYVDVYSFIFAELGVPVDGG
jgi:prolyl oligopeptidase